MDNLSYDNELNFDYRCHYCDDALTEEEVSYDEDGNECCMHCYTDTLYRDEYSDI